MDFKEYDANDIGTDRMYQSINNDLNWDELDEPHKDRYATVFGEHDGMLHTIDTFVRRVEKRNEGGFKIELTKTDHFRIHEQVLGRFYFPLFDKFIRIQDDSRVYSPHVALFFEAIQALGIDRRDVYYKPGWWYPFWKKTGAHLFNDLIAWIREETKTPAFKRKVRSLASNASRNFSSNSKFALALIKDYSKVLVLRVDFYYQKKYAHGVTTEQAHKDRQHFLNNLRQNSLFDHLLGTIWKLEYGKDRGHHFHFMLFFNGQERRNADWLADQVGQYWCARIVPDKGDYHNCNRGKRLYWNCGIGMIHHADAKKIQDLLIATRYLTKKDQYVMVKRSSKCRTIGRSEMPKPKQSNAGRPRICT